MITPGGTATFDPWLQYRVIVPAPPAGYSELDAWISFDRIPHYTSLHIDREQGAWIVSIATSRDTSLWVNLLDSRPRQIGSLKASQTSLF